MDGLFKQISELEQEFSKAFDQLEISKLNKQLQALEAQAKAPDFWDDSTRAQRIMQDIAKQKARVQPWLELQHAIQETQELAKLNDETLGRELSQQYTHLTETFSALKEQLMLNTQYDDHDALLSIYSGAGGTDAQDWAQMLLRMYTRYCEKVGWKVSSIEYSAGEEAGIKSATVAISGPFAYGKLKGEHGVHRLVRLSPYNADNLRQTSFAKVEVMPKIDKPDELQINDKDLKVDVYRSGGHGGQSVNTTDSAVRVTHLPTGLSVAIQNERSQLQNKETALTILRSRLAQLQLEQHQDHLEDLKGPSQSAEWGNQIRSYVLHPYKQVKDLRTQYETSDPDDVLDGNLNGLIDAYLEFRLHV